jgi:hypothetical protein
MANRFKQSLKRMSWTSPKTFELDGLNYLVDVSTYQYRTDPDRLVILKAPDYWRAYAQGLRDAPTRNVLELGVWQGGSAMAFSSLLTPEKLVAIDICEPIEAFDQIRASHPAGGPIEVYYDTSQGDRTRVSEIISSEFSEPLDLVIDDASHDYHLTKAAFETIFPHLRPDGIYAIEDWGWAHSESFRLWTDKPAMSNLIYQLLMVNAGHPDLISSIHVFRGVAFVRKGPKAPVGEPLELDKVCWTQGRPFRLL